MAPTKCPPKGCAYLVGWGFDHMAKLYCIHYTVLGDASWNHDKSSVKYEIGNHFHGRIVSHQKSIGIPLFLIYCHIGSLLNVVFTPLNYCHLHYTK